jgi:MFS transporter, putative metabolite:H+ symporter
MTKEKVNINFTVFVAALGYFVDIFDLTLFGVLRVSSLKDLNLTPEQITNVGLNILSIQMLGMLIGGILWGIIGDKIGRKFAMFGSILTFSLANIANAFILDVNQYTILRFIAGIGLAGQLGSAITLVSELAEKEKRGYYNTIIAALGLLGAIFASLLSFIFHWRTMYLIGGVLGLILLLLRYNTLESQIFKEKDKIYKKESLANKMKNLNEFFEYIKNIFMIFIRYIRILAVGIPIWFVFSILLTFSLEVSQAINKGFTANPAISLMLGYIGVSLGDILAGIMSQKLKSRKKPIFIFLILLSINILLYIHMSHNLMIFYFFNLTLGILSGYWVLFLTIGAEEFGTNIRSTVVNTLPNFVRGSVYLIVLIFKSFKDILGFINSTLIIGFLFIILAIISLIFIRETFARDLHFFEEI